MPEFKYIAKDQEGESHSGNIQAFDTKTAAVTLRKKRLVVISISPKDPPASRFLAKFLDKVSFTSIVIVTRQLATMVSSGLVLSDAMDILEEQQTNKTLKKALGEISQDIKGGLSLAQSLGKYPDIFPPLYINLVKSGEQSGKLDKVLLQMADGLEKDREFRARVKGAMIYPGVVVGMMGIVIIIMMVFVIPKLTSLYSESKIELPLPTKILIFTSNAFANFWWLGLMILGAGAVAVNRWKKTEEGNYFLSKLTLRLPIIGKLVTNITLTNFTRTFGLLSASGIPLLDAINIVSGLTENMVFKNALKEAYVGVEKGLPLSVLLTTDVFPKIVGQMVKVGEETGKVDEIFFKLSEYFESESDHLVKNLTVAVEPIILVILGIGVAFLVFSIITPIYQLTNAIQ